MWWLQVRSSDGLKCVNVDVVSRLTKIENVRERLVKYFHVQPSRQRLFYRGKQMEDGHTLFDYDVGPNHVISLMERAGMTPPVAGGNFQNEKENVNVNGVGSPSEAEMVEQRTFSEQDSTDGLYKVNEEVDARDLTMGAWFEARVVRVTKDAPMCNGAPGSSRESEPTIYYYVTFDGYSEKEVTKVTAADIRPRARYRFPLDQLVPGNKVMVNYNSEHPKERGFWYDAVITRKDTATKQVYAKLVFGEATNASEEIMVTFVDEIFRIETKNQLEEAVSHGREEVVTRKKAPDCNWCKDNPRRKCKHCACCECGGKDSPDKQILCDECDMAYHIWCLSPKLETVPKDDWYCPSCKTDTSGIIAAGEKLKVTKKTTKCKRDYGGASCAPCASKCTIVPTNHFGSIPGVPVGNSWLKRQQVVESGVHRLPVAGIHGRIKEGAFSIVVSGGFKEDIDEGEEFVYSGCGGNDLSGNKRISKDAVRDQKLTRMNRALALNCDAPLSNTGATAKDWKKGKPIRVVRNYKERTAYSPKEGNRYDGLYKVVKYWPEKDKTKKEFIVWKYLMRRDDPSPAPWTDEGKKMIEQLELTMQYPVGYSKPKKGQKRKAADIDDSPDIDAPFVVTKKARFELSEKQLALIEKDTANKKLWDDLLNSGTAGLLTRIQDALTCVICQEVVYQPVTLTCSHNICRHCLVRSFKADVHSCPICRCELGKEFDFQVNLHLQEALLEVFPGYDGGRLK